MNNTSEMRNARISSNLNTIAFPTFELSYTWFTKSTNDLAILDRVLIALNSSNYDVAKIFGTDIMVAEKTKNSVASNRMITVNTPIAKPSMVKMFGDIHPPKTGEEQSWRFPTFTNRAEDAVMAFSKEHDIPVLFFR